MNKQKPFDCDLKTYEGYIARKEYWDDLSTEWSFSTKEEKIIRLGDFVQQGGSLLRLLNRYAKEHDERYRERIQYCVLSYWRAHPEVSITSYESRILIHRNGAYVKSLW